MSQINEQPLSTFLSTPGTNAPATTALDLVNLVSPIYFNLLGDTSLSPHYSPGDLTTMRTSADSQEKLSALLWPSTGTPAGISGGDCVGLLFAAVKQIATLTSQFFPVGQTGTTNGSGVLVVNLTPLNLANTPIVSLTTQHATPIVATITALSSTSLSILTQDLTAAAVSSIVHIVVFPQ